jgi:hypothetical protein
VTKTKGQLEKKKRETEKRKQLEKAVLRIAAAMPDDDSKAQPAASGASPREARPKP